MKRMRTAFVGKQRSIGQIHPDVDSQNIEIL